MNSYLIITYSLLKLNYILHQTVTKYNTIHKKLQSLPFTPIVQTITESNLLIILFDMFPTQTQ